MTLETLFIPYFIIICEQNKVIHSIFNDNFINKTVVINNVTTNF